MEDLVEQQEKLDAALGQDVTTEYKPDPKPVILVRSFLMKVALFLKKILYYNVF